MAFQLYETSSISKIQDLRRLNASMVDVAKLPTNCTTSNHLQDYGYLTSSIVDSAFFEAGTFFGASVETLKNSGKILLLLNISFPLSVMETSLKAAQLVKSSIVSMDFKAFAVDNFTQAYCSVPRCPKDLLCIEKMSSGDFKDNVATWQNAEKLLEQQPVEGCQLQTSAGSSRVLKGTGIIEQVQIEIIKDVLILETMTVFSEWSSDFPKSFLKGISNINITLASISLSVIYKQDVSQKQVNWFLTTDGLISLTLMGILGFNVLVIIFALLFCACSRSKRGFEMEIWDYSLSKKSNEDTEPW